MTEQAKPGLLRSILVLAVAGIAYFVYAKVGGDDATATNKPGDGTVRSATGNEPPAAKPGSPPARTGRPEKRTAEKRRPEPRTSDGAERIEQAFRRRESDVIVEAAGVVSRVLADDNEGSRHQKWIVRLDSGRTVLMAHNIDLAPRVPLKRGDEIAFKGEYEWNDRGGVVHWTHHDPRNRHPGGWIRHRGKVYE